MSKSKGIFKSSLILSGVIILIKLAGMVKQMVVAGYYGTSIETDIWFLAYSFESTITEILFSTLSVTIVLIYLDEINEHGRPKASDFISSVIMTFTSIAILVSIIIIGFANPIASILGPSYVENEHEYLSRNIRTLAIVTIFSPAIMTLSSVFNAEKHFVKGKISTLISNIIDILMIVAFARLLGIEARNYAYILSSVVNVSLLVWFSKEFVKLRLLKFSLDFRLKKLIRLTVPIMFGNGTTILLTLADRIISSYLGEGGVSALDYSSSIYSILISFVSTALVTVLTTHFAEMVSRKKFNELGDQFIKISRLVLLPMVIICCMFFCLSSDVVRVLFQRGRFDAASTALVSYAVRGYIIAAVFVVVKDIAVRLLYSLELTKYPFYASIVSGVVNVVASIVLMQKLGVLGITLGTAVAEIVCTVICLNYLRKALPSFSLRSFMRSLIPYFIGGSVGVLLMFFFNLLLKDCNWAIRSCTVTILGAFIYIVILRVLNVEELKLYADRLCHIMKRGQ